MRRGRAFLAAATCAVALSGLTACFESESRGAAETGDTAVVYAQEQEFDSYNTQASRGSDPKNAVVMNQVTSGFWRFAPDGSIEPNTEFGTYRVVDPLTVVYTFADAAQWSDGQPLDCDDAVLQYVANSGKYAEAFDSADTSGYELIGDVGCADGDKAFTVTYVEPFADWEALFGTFLPAHVVEAQSGVADLVAAVRAGDAAALQAVGGFWSGQWSGFEPGRLPDPALIPSSGPFTLGAWQAGRSLTLVANEHWWGDPPKSGSVEIRVLAGDSQAEALADGEVHVMDPQPTPRLLSAMPGEGVDVTVADSSTLEQVDLNHGSGVFRDPRVRAAFAHCVPRQQIIEEVVSPANPDAIVANSRYLMPFQDGYADVVAAAVGTEYDEVNVERARALLAEAWAEGATVRLGYLNTNELRSQTFGLIAQSCGQAGFTVIDAGSATFLDEGGELESGDFDVAMLPSDVSPRVTKSSARYVTGGSDNHGSYANAAVDDLLIQLSMAVDRQQQMALITQIETILWDDIATIPLFAWPGMAASSREVVGVEYNAAAGALTWNLQEWALR